MMANLMGGSQPNYWIRDNTPPEAIVVTPLYIFRFENIVPERAVFVKRTQSSFTDNIPAYDHRVYQLTVFYNEYTSHVEYQNLITDMEAQLPGRQLYAVVKDAEVRENAMRQRGATLVYENENDGANVYLLNPNYGRLLDGRGSDIAGNAVSHHFDCRHLESRIVNLGRCFRQRGIHTDLADAGDYRRLAGFVLADADCATSRVYLAGSPQLETK